MFLANYKQLASLKTRSISLCKLFLFGQFILAMSKDAAVEDDVEFSAVTINEHNFSLCEKNTRKTIGDFLFAVFVE